MTAFFGRLDAADLSRPCADEGGDSAGETVGAVTVHMAEGYHHLGRFLQASGYVPAVPAAENRHEHGHGLPRPIRRIFLACWSAWLAERSRSVRWRT
ncbi:hypothetical protein ACFSVJ_28485 [Prauserella oleivorans]